MTFKWSKGSIQRRAGVHPDLIAVSNKALSYGLIDMTIPLDGGVRSVARQKELVAKGVSKTLKSKHLIQPDGYGHALDVIPFPVDWEDTERFTTVAGLMKKAAKELGIAIEWGGDWKWKDFPHYQLPTKGE